MVLTFNILIKKNISEQRKKRISLILYLIAFWPFIAVKFCLIVNVIIGMA